MDEAVKSKGRAERMLLKLQLEMCSIEHRKRKKAWRAVVERRKGKGKMGLVGTFSLRSTCNGGASQVAQW